MDVPRTAPNRVFVALGGNLGPVSETFQRAHNDIDDLPDTTLGRISATHQFPAVGREAGGVFSNAACELFTRLPPLTLLHALQRIERAHGRTRDVRRGPRTLDLDVILYGEEVIETPELTVPHPACWYRRFVLDPLVEIAAGLVHPLKGATFGELRERLLARPLRVGLCGDSTDARVALVSALRPQFPGVEWCENWQPDTDVALLFRLGDAPPWESLPLLPRLQVPPGDPTEFVRDAVTAALGTA